MALLFDYGLLRPLCGRAMTFGEERRSRNDDDSTSSLRPTLKC